MIRLIDRWYLWRSGYADTGIVEPLVGTILVVAGNHVAVRHLVKQKKDIKNINMNLPMTFHFMSKN